MPKVSEAKKPYFPHDLNASQDKKILKMFYFFKRLVKTTDRKDLEELAVKGAYGIFWRIVEFLHAYSLKSEEIEILADNLEVNKKFIELILTNFELFRQEDGYYISDRIIKNLEEQEEKAQKSITAANTRWLLSALKKAHLEIFGTEPILSREEIESLKKSAVKIDNFRDKIPDLLYSLKNVKFSNDISIKADIHWLLTKNNIFLLNDGHWGKLRNWEEEKNRRKEEKALKESNKEDTPLTDLSEFDTKIKAIEFLTKNYSGKKLQYIHPAHKKLLKKFDITIKELEEFEAKKNA